MIALKQVRISPGEHHNGVPITALREISILRSLKHNNIIKVFDVAVGEKAIDEIYMVMEYAEQVGDPEAEGFPMRQLQEHGRISLAYCSSAFGWGKCRFC